MSWTGKSYPFTMQNLIKITIFQNDGTSRYFGLQLWELVHLLNLVCSFQGCVLFMCLIKL